MFFYLQMQAVHLSYDRHISCFQGDRKEGQNITPAVAFS